jgi:predicted aldo/keto reductase-like oxidoreductase
MRYQYQWQDTALSRVPQSSQENLEATIKHALDLGINHIETARGYGTSEMQLGQILPHLQRDKIIVQTKVSPNENPKEFRKDFDTSFNYLNLDYVDLLGIHGINTPELLDISIRSGGCLDEAKKLQQQGKVRYIGFSTHGDTETIVKTIETGQFDYVNLHWYYINQINWPAIEAAQKQDMGVFIISPSDKGGKLYEPSQKLIDLCYPLSPMVFNNLFCLSHPQIHTLSIGAAKPSDFDEHIKTLNYLDQNEEILTEIIQRLEQEMIKTFGENWVKNWQNGLPSYHETPHNINIYVILWLRMLVLAYDMIEYGKMRYNLLGNGGHWFPGNNAEKVKKIDLNDCLKNSPFRQEIPELLIDTHRLLGGKSVFRLSGG